MTVIYRTSDKVKVKVDDITIKISPLTYSQKQQVQSLMQKAIKEGDMSHAMEGAILAIKKSLKSIDGLSTRDGEAYSLEIEDGEVSDSSIDDLLNLHYSDKISAICTSLVNGVGSRYVLDPDTKETLEGVTFVEEEVAEKK